MLQLCWVTRAVWITGCLALAIGFPGWGFCQGGGGTAGGAGTPDPAALTAEELVTGGEAALVAGRFAEAAELFGFFVDGYGAEPGFGEVAEKVRPLLALALVRAGEFGRARPLIVEVLASPATTAAQREELRFWGGVAALQSGEHGAARAAFEGLARDPSVEVWRRAEAVVLVGAVELERGAPAEAADYLVGKVGWLRESGGDEAAGRAVVLRLAALVEAGRDGEALQLLRDEFPRSGAITQIIAFQSTSVQLGARLLESGDYHGAIAALQRVWAQERLLRHQRSRAEALEAEIAVAGARGGQPERVYQLAATLKRVNRELASFEAVEGFDSSVRARLVSAFFGLGRLREAALVSREMLASLPPDRTVEQVAVNLVRTWNALGRWDDAVAAAELYQKKFAGSATPSDAAAVAFARAEAFRQQREFALAAEAYDSVVERFGDEPVAADAEFMRATVDLDLDECAGAIAKFGAFRESRPEHRLAPDALFWSGMGFSFDGAHAEAFAVMADYLERHPGGRYAPDAVFRQAFCRFAEADYPDATARLRLFLEQHPGSPLGDEARLLLGDALLATGEIDAGIGAYRSIDPASVRFFEDGWFKTGKAFWMTGEFDDMREHFREFIGRFPTSHRVAEAVYQIGRADAEEGDEAAALASYWKTVRDLGNEPKAFAIEEILTSLPRFYRGGGRAELVRELDALRRSAEVAGERTLVARALWAQSALVRDGDPGRARALLLAAGDFLRPRVHNPELLVDCADARRDGGFPRVAGELYREIRRWHPRCPERDRVYAGLGMLADGAGDVAVAIDWFGRAARVSFRPALKADVTIRRARLLAGRAPGEAMAGLEALAGDRATAARDRARALLVAGEVLELSGNTRKALAYYERVYLAYAKFGDLVAQAYERRAAALERLGMRAEAAEVRSEMDRLGDSAVAGGGVEGGVPE